MVKSSGELDNYSNSLMDDTKSIAEQLSEFAPDAIVVVDERGVIRFANQAAVVLFRCARETLVGQPMDALIPDRFRDRHAALVTGYFYAPTNREMGARVGELYARRTDGSEFPAAIRLAPLRTGDMHYVAAAVRDVTEQRAMSDALVRARAEADRANRAKSRFLATASHDLRQPLQSIRLLNAAMMKTAEDYPALLDLLRRQEFAIDGASRLLNALLDISRLESGAVEPQLSPTKLADLFVELKREFEPSAGAKKLQLEVSPTHVTLRTDRVLLAQLLQNLIGNAIKYTERGYVRVGQTMEPDSLLITVEDTGAGIPNDKLERVFDEYYQLGPQGTQRLGVGLGLAIVREVAGLLNYSVEVASTVGQGTLVRVRIPQQLLLPQVQSPCSEQTRGSLNAGAMRCRVIVVEDNDSVRAATQLFLSLEGYETVSAASFAETATLMADMGPGDILIADYHLGGKQTGVDVLRHVRSHLGYEVPAILLSGDLQSMMRAMQKPIARCRYLSKPVDTAQLLRAIAELLAADAQRADASGG